MGTDTQERRISSPEESMRAQWAVAAAVAAVVGLVKPVSAVVPDHAETALAASEAPDMEWWRQSMRTHDQRIQWWREARFGMFIHWGVYSALAGEWQGKPVQGYAEHVQRKAKIPIETYKTEVAGKFNPTKFNADEWVKLAYDAGMRYIVITSKHHDGFAMFDSDVSDYNIVKATAWHHDPMKDLKAACAKQGVRFGFYYSQAWDWGCADAPGNDWDFEQPAGDRQLHGGKTWWEESPEYVTKCAKYVDNKAVPQLRELIAKYHPDIIWFDTNNKMPPSENFRVLKATRQAGPDVVINSRIVPELGDYLSTTDRPAEFAPHDGDWEGIPTTNESYGYHKSDHSHKPPEHFIPLIVKAAARGGNLMLNVGPRGDGTIDPPDVAILQGIGKWMKVNGESIHGTTRTPLSVQAWGESTRKDNTLYLHVFNWPSDGKLLVGGLKSIVKSAYLLSDPNKASLKFDHVDDVDVVISVPSQAPDSVDTVVVVECGNDPAAEPGRVLSSTQSNVLRVFDGKLHGDTIKFAQGKRENAYLEQWSDPDDSISWPVRLLEPATFEVSATYDAENSSAGGKYQVATESQKLIGTVKEGIEQSQRLGNVRLESGFHEIRVTAAQTSGKELMRLRSLTLTSRNNETSSR